jgi:hypothetical protein
VFIGYEEGSKAYRILDPGTLRVRTTRDVVLDEGRGWVWDKAMDDGTIEYVHFEGARGVGDPSPSRPTPAPKSPPTPAPRSPAPTTTSSSPPRNPATTPSTASSSSPRTPAPTVPSPGTSSLTPARVEHNPVELVTSLSHDEEHVDACYNGEPLRYRKVEGLLINPSVSGPESRILAGELHLTCDDGEPRSFAEAEKHVAWRGAMQSEMDAVETNRTWELADLPHGHRANTLKWVFKLKRDEVGAIVKHMARLVAHGFLQQEGIDFDDAFSPVAWMEYVRLLALSAQEGWHVHHMDVKSTFLNSDLKEVYVHQPPGFAIPGKEGKMLRLRKTLYGLRQAPRAWNAKMDSTLKRMGLMPSPDKAAIYRWGNEKMPCWWVSTSTIW